MVAVSLLLISRVCFNGHSYAGGKNSKGNEECEFFSDKCYFCVPGAAGVSKARIPLQKRQKEVEPLACCHLEKARANGCIPLSQLLSHS